MANYFWKGGIDTESQTAGNWVTTSDGSTAHTSIPGSDDDLFFDLTSTRDCIFTSDTVTYNSIEIGEDFGHQLSVNGSTITITKHGSSSYENAGQLIISGVKKITCETASTFVFTSANNGAGVEYSTNSDIDEDLGVFANNESRQLLTFHFNYSGLTTLVLGEGVYPNITLTNAKFSPVTSTVSSPYQEVKMLAFTVNSSSSVQPHTSISATDLDKIYRIEGDITCSSDTFKWGKSILKLAPVTAGEPFPFDGNIASFGTGTPKVFNAEYYDLRIIPLQNQSTNYFNLTAGALISVNSFTVESSGRIYGPSSGASAEVHTLKKPTVRGDWNFQRISDGVYRSITRKPLLNITQGGTGLNAIGEAGRVLAVHSSGEYLEWSATAGGTSRTVTVDTDGDGSADATLGASETLMLKKGSNITLAESGGVVTISSTDTDTNTQLSTEEVQDIVGAMVSSNTETNISVTYDDTGGKLNFASTDTNTQLSNEEVQDIVGAMVDGGTETNISVTYDDTAGKLNFVSTDTNTQLTTEEVQDIVGAMVDGGTETNIAVTYDDTGGKLNFVSTDTNTQLTTEQVQDIVGAMFTGNTETRVSATYEDGDGTIDLVVDDMTADTNTNQLTEFTLAGDSGSSQTIAHGNTLTIAGGTNITSVASATDTITLNVDDAFLKNDADDTTTGTITAAGLNLTAANDHPLVIRNTTNAGYAGIQFSDASNSSYSQSGELRFNHADAQSDGSGASFHFTSTESLNVIMPRLSVHTSLSGNDATTLTGKEVFKVDCDDGSGQGGGPGFQIRLESTNDHNGPNYEKVIMGDGGGQRVKNIHGNYGFSEWWLAGNADGKKPIMSLTSGGSTSAGAAQDGILQLYSTTDAWAANTYSPTNNTTKVKLDAGGDSYFTGGDVGIGTTSPSTELHLSGADHPSIRVTGTDNANADPAIELLGTADNFTEGGQLWYDNGTGVLHLSSLYNNDAADIQFHTKTAADRSTSNVRMTIAGDGNVGIGTTSPAFPLEVDGFISTASGIVHMGDTNNTITFGTDTQSFNTDSTTRMHITSAGRVGIGNTSPDGFLHIKHTDNTGVPGVIIECAASAAQSDAVLRLKESHGSSTFIDFTLNTFGQLEITGGASTRRQIFTADDPDTDDSGIISLNKDHYEWNTQIFGDSSTPVIFVDGTNNRMGVGTTSPSEKLTVDGNISTTGNLTVAGNLTISGSTTTLNTATLTVEDNIIVLNSNVTGTPPDVDAGIEVERGDETNPTFLFDEGDDKWVATTPGSGISFQMNNANGYIAFGPQNTSYAHITTDRSRFYFNRDLVIGENAISSYNGDFKIRRSQSADEQITIADNSMTFTSAGNDVVKLDGSNQRLGIKQTSPQHTLDVAGSVFIGNSNETTALTGSATLEMKGDTSLMTFKADNGSSGEQIAGIRVFADHYRAAGMVIGDYDNSDGSTTEDWIFGRQYASSNKAGIMATPENGGDEYITVQSHSQKQVIIANDSDDIDLLVKGTGGTYLFGQASSGNLGIGTTSPDAPLHVEHTSGLIAKFGEGNVETRMQFADARAMIGYVGDSLMLQGGAGNKFVRFAVNNGTFGSGEVARFDASGNFGIGDTTPSYKLDVDGDIRAQDDMYTDKLIASQGIRSSSRASFNTMQMYYFDRESMGTSAVYLRVPVGGSSSANPGSYAMPHAGQVMQVMYQFYGSTFGTGTDTWKVIRTDTNGNTAECDFTIAHGDVNQIGSTTNRNILKDISALDDSITFAAGDIIQIQRSTANINVTNVSAQLWVTFDI